MDGAAALGSRLAVRWYPPISGPGPVLTLPTESPNLRFLRYTPAVAEYEEWLERWIAEDGERVLELLRKVVVTCG